MTGTFDMLLATLFTAFRKELDEAAALLYERGLVDISLPLLDAAVTRAVKTRTFLPVIAELRADAESCRSEFLAQHPYEKCPACKESNGWVTLTDGQGVERMAKCTCFAVYRAELSAIGITDRPVLMLADRGDERAS